MEDLLSLLSCIAPVLSQAPEQFVWPRLSEEDGGGPGKDPGQARVAQTRRMGMPNEKANRPKRRGCCPTVLGETPPQLLVSVTLINVERNEQCAVRALHAGNDRGH